MKQTIKGHIKKRATLYHRQLMQMPPTEVEEVGQNGGRIVGSFVIGGCPSNQKKIFIEQWRGKLCYTGQDAGQYKESVT